MINYEDIPPWLRITEMPESKDVFRQTKEAQLLNRDQKEKYYVLNPEETIRFMKSKKLNFVKLSKIVGISSEYLAKILRGEQYISTFTIWLSLYSFFGNLIDVDCPIPSVSDSNYLYVDMYDDFCKQCELSSENEYKQIAQDVLKKYFEKIPISRKERRDYADLYKKKRKMQHMSAERK